MKNIKNTIELFQTSAFRVSNPEEFLTSKHVQQIVRVMDYLNLTYRLSDGYLSLSLPPEALHVVAFEDDTNKVTRDNLLGAVVAIESHILEGDVCKMIFTEAKAGEFFNVYTSVIERNKSDNGKVTCDHFLTYGWDGFQKPNY